MHMIIHLQLSSLVHTGRVLFCMFILCWVYLDATRLGGSANNSDPSRANSYQQPLWKHHPRRWQTHCLTPCWSQVCGSNIQTHTSTHTYTITEWPLVVFASGLSSFLILCVWREVSLTHSALSSDAIRMPTVSSTERLTLFSLWTLWDQLFFPSLLISLIH